MRGYLFHNSEGGVGGGALDASLYFPTNAIFKMGEAGSVDKMDSSTILEAVLSSAFNGHYLKVDAIEDRLAKLSMDNLADCQVRIRDTPFCL